MDTISKLIRSERTVDSLTDPVIFLKVSLIMQGSPITVVHEIVPSNPVPGPRRWVISAGLSWSMGVLLCFLIEGLRPLSDQAQVIMVAAALTALGLIGAAAMSGELDLRTALARLKLGPWMGIGFSLGFGLATLVWLGDVKAYHGLVTRSSLGPAATVTAVGFIAFVLAFHSTPPWLREWGRTLDRSLRGGGTLSSSAWGVWALWTVSMLAAGMGFVRGNVGYLVDPSAAMSTSSSANAVLSALTQMGLLATVMAGWRAAVNRRPASMLLLMWVASSQLVLGLFSGMKEAAIIQLVAVVIGYSARGRLRLAPLVAAGLLAVFVVTPFVTAYRTVISNSSGRLSPSQALQTVRFDQLIGGLTSGDAAGGSVGDSSDRWSRIGDVAIIMVKTPSTIGYKSPVDLVVGPFLGFVPRSVWPDKPVLDAGYQVNHQYYEMPAKIYSSASVTPYGDLYRFGGVVIVIIGMVILGMFVRVVDDRGASGSDIDPRLLFLPMLLFTNLVKQEKDYVGLSAAMVGFILTAALAARMVSERTKPSL